MHVLSNLTPGYWKIRANLRNARHDISIMRNQSIFCYIGRYNYNSTKRGIVTTRWSCISASYTLTDDDDSMDGRD